MSAKLVVTLSPPKAAKKAPAQPGRDEASSSRDAPAKRVRAPKIEPTVVEFGLSKDGSDVLLSTAANWTYRLSPQLLMDFNTPWDSILAIEDRQDLDGVLLTVEDRALVDMKKCTARQVHLAIQLYSLANLSPS